MVFNSMCSVGGKACVQGSSDNVIRVLAHDQNVFGPLFRRHPSGFQVGGNRLPPEFQHVSQTNYDSSPPCRQPVEGFEGRLE